MISEETVDRARAGRGLSRQETQALALEITMLSRIAWAATDYRAQTAHRGPESNELDAALDAWRETTS